MKPAAELASLIRDRPILVLGKGPSLTTDAFQRHRTGTCVLGINQTVRTFPCDVAFFIDIEPFHESCAELMESRPAVVLPWHPNQRTRVRRISRPIAENLGDLCSKDTVLRALRDQGRLYYFHTFFKDRRHASNVFEPNLVSFSALLQILGEIGVRDVRTLGIDGGTGHSTSLKGSMYTQVPGGYDKQFPILRRISMTRRITMSRADATDIRVFVGCEPAQWLPSRLLEYSILKNTSERVSFRRLHEALAGAGVAATGRTPFSYQRFFVPELCGFEGLAVYLDSDMQVFGDLRELIGHYEDGMALVSADSPPGSERRPQFSVMVINCALARWNGPQIVKRIHDDYENTMFAFDFEPKRKATIPYQWNSLERYEPGRTRLLHYTDMDLQPWLSNRNHLARVWVAALNEAIRDGFLSFEDVRREVSAGHARPGLLYQVESDEPDPLAIPRRERLKDELFMPPHTVARFSRRNNALVRASLALARRAIHAVRGAR